jgi:hypothetical protein
MTAWPNYAASGNGAITPLFQVGNIVPAVPAQISWTS